MITWRNAGAAFILTLFLALVLCTTGAFASSVQVDQRAAMHTASLVQNRLGGAPIMAGHVAPVARAIPAGHARHVWHRPHHAHGSAAHTVYATAVAIATTAHNHHFFDGFPYNDWHFWWFPVHPWLP